MVHYRRRTILANGYFHSSSHCVTSWNANWDLSCIPGLLSTAADKCSSSPCLNNTCIELQDDYMCLCTSGPVWYMGKQCEELYDACIQAPCTNCTSYLGSVNFTCHCPDDFTGLNCSEGVDPCQNNPCKGIKSHCVNEINGYSCHCPPGLIGEDCHANLTTCSEEVCQNGGTCMNIPHTGYRCQCAAGYQGRNCEENINECQSEPCKNGAICKDRVNAYQCFCVPGFQGFHCDLDINECASQPCQNNGTCVDEIDHYRCECAPGFKGKTPCLVSQRYNCVLWKQKYSFASYRSFVVSETSKVKQTIGFCERVVNGPIRAKAEQVYQ